MNCATHYAQLTHKNKLVWLFPDGVLPLTPHRLRFEIEQYVIFTKAGKTVKAPSSILSMFLEVSQSYRWFPDLPEETTKPSESKRISPGA